MLAFLRVKTFCKMMSSPLHRGWSTGDLVTHYYNSLYFKLYVRFAPFALHFTWPDACYILRQRRTLYTFSVQTRSFGFNLQVISRSLRNSSKLHPNNPENCDPSRGRFHHVCSGKNVLCAMLRYDPRRDLDISTHYSGFYREIAFSRRLRGRLYGMPSSRCLGMLQPSLISPTV